MQKPSDGIGDRLAYYRKLSGMSAERLSQRVPMSRAVIANIESGRKRDITVDEMLSLAWALDIPPVALALPIEQPNVFVDLGTSENRSDATRAHTAINWFMTGRKTGTSASPQQLIAATRIGKLREFYTARDAITRYEAAISRGDTAAEWASLLAEEKARLRDITEELYGLGVDLNYYSVEDTGLPDGDD